MPTADVKARVHAQDRGEPPAAAQEAMRQHRTFLFDADVDGDLNLSFEEFVSALPTHLRATRSLSDLRSWFDMVDGSRDGRVTLNEWFQFSLSASAIVTGAGVVQTFQRYDASGEGKLDKGEFFACAEDAGYGEFAAQLWDTLPKNPNGTLSYSSLINSHQSKIDLAGTDEARDEEAGPEPTRASPGAHAPEDKPSSCLIKSMLTDLAWTNVSVDLLSAQEAEQCAWAFDAPDAKSLRQELAKVLRWHSVRLSELFSAIDTDNNEAVSQDEWCRGLIRLLGFQGGRTILIEAFHSLLDANHDQHISFEELDAYIRGRALVGQEAVASAIGQLQLQPSADDEPWSIDRLRTALCSQLDEIGLTLEDLLEFWDKEWVPDGDLTRREVLGQFKRLVNKGLKAASSASASGLDARPAVKRAGPSTTLGSPVSTAELLWYQKVRGAVSDIFDAFDANKTHTLSLANLSRAFASKAYREAQRLNELIAASTLDDNELLCSYNLRKDLEEKYAAEPKRRPRREVRLSKPRRVSPVRRRAKIVRDVSQEAVTLQLPPISTASRLLSSTFVRESASNPALPLVTIPMATSHRPALQVSKGSTSFGNLPRLERGTRVDTRLEVAHERRKAKWRPVAASGSYRSTTASWKTWKGDWAEGEDRIFQPL